MRTHVSLPKSAMSVSNFAFDPPPPIDKCSAGSQSFNGSDLEISDGGFSGREVPCRAARRRILLPCMTDEGASRGMCSYKQKRLVRGCVTQRERVLFSKLALKACITLDETRN